MKTIKFCCIVYKNSRFDKKYDNIIYTTYSTMYHEKLYKIKEYPGSRLSRENTLFNLYNKVRI